MVYLIPCACSQEHDRRRIVLTGGPGAGKTAVLELVRQHFCRHIVVLPESASMLFGGGFPRLPALGARKAAQRAIFRVQREMETAHLAAEDAATFLCDRGTLDGLAYWPGPPDEMLASLATTREAEFSEYAAVIHLRTPLAGEGYNRSNALRIESAEQAAAIDARILDAWAGHPRRVLVESTPDFLAKATSAIAALKKELPMCCQRIPVD
jgi:predicted ATPase